MDIQDTAELEPMRCHRCGRLLLRIQRRALKSHQVLEVKCKCTTFNYLIGTASSS